MSVIDSLPIADLVARQTPGMTLEQPFYNDPGVFQRDLEAIVAKQWLFVDHISALPTPGDYITYEIAGESIILVHAKGGAIHAFFNVCRHRGSRICLNPKGHVRTLTCPYHAWVWDLEGKLIRARQMPEDFKPEDWPLHACAVRVWNGMIFINLAPEGDPQVADFAAMARDLGPYIDHANLASAKVVHTELYPTDANWKLAVENFHECYHCAPAHPEYTMVNAYVNDGDRDPEGRQKVVQDWRATWQIKGHAVDFLGPETRDPRQPWTVFRQPIRDGFHTLSQDGSYVAPLLNPEREPDDGEALLAFGPLFYIYLCTDHATLFRFTPVSANFSEVSVSWVVRGDAVEGRDFDVDKLKWMWDVTTIEDTKIINDNQKGVNSRRYTPGRYSTREGWTREFIDWYLSRVA
jgi:phenylpropionate dioxygenase-like ring-hydroxylating dioxygenase large terminal subunit